MENRILHFPGNIKIKFYSSKGFFIKVNEIEVKHFKP